jgi:hypothetical protein
VSRSSPIAVRAVADTSVPPKAPSMRLAVWPDPLLRGLCYRLREKECISCQRLTPSVTRTRG